MRARRRERMRVRMARARGGLWPRHALTRRRRRANATARRQLMLREDLTKLGYHGEGSSEDARGDASKRGDAHQSEAREQNRRGFVAGVPKSPPPQPRSE